ncbi:MAG: helix-hairpin-helix domain-containing protein [Candidatus Gastranaerophilales bacterium]|nr:helix-hairpin-helix domain-containing protein [Candidatus Gastranaerophilales bacterium]MCM1072713.1 helix-hairpin-helix domain-containing protein [Bacteroides sp.]
MFIWCGYIALLSHNGINQVAIIGILTIVVFAIAVFASYIIHRIMYKQTRQKSLAKAAKYLKPYNNIWKGLELNNSYCSITLKTCTNLCLQELNSRITRQATIYTLNDIKLEKNNYLESIEVWDVLCMNFSDETTFDSIIQSCKMMDIAYKIKISRSPKPERTVTPKPIVENKTDINNANIEELKTLPFINTALAKRIIKKREEVNGFKSVDDVCLYLKFNVEKSMKFREYICVNLREIPLSEVKNDERSVDC